MKKYLCYLTIAASLLLNGPVHAGFITFDMPGALNTYIFGVNNAGQAVGSYNTDSTSTVSFVRNADGSYESFIVPGATGTFAFDINNNGDIVGEITTAEGRKGFIRTAGGDYVIFEYPGAEGTEAQGINDVGDIVGSYYLNGSPRGFFRSSSGDFTPFDISGASDTNPQKLNNFGVIVGTSSGYGAFSGTLAGGFQSLGINGSLAMGINNLGDIVGRIDPAAFFLDVNGTLSTFHLPGTQTTQFYDISDSMLIGGTYQDGTGFVHGLLGMLGPTQPDGSIPEPATIALIGLGLVGMGALRRRKSAPA